MDKNYKDLQSLPDTKPVKVLFEAYNKGSISKRAFCALNKHFCEASFTYKHLLWGFVNLGEREKQVRRHLFELYFREKEEKVRKKFRGPYSSLINNIFVTLRRENYDKMR